jgi:oligoribonuclease
MAPSSHNFVWIDLEMTGLDPACDVILEIATIVTDSSLNILEKGLSLVIHQPDAVLSAMNDWCKNQHKKSGLWEEVCQSTVSLGQAATLTYEYISEYCTPQTAPLCGNTIFQDRAFLRAYMSQIDTLLHYRIVDVSSVKELVKKWYPKDLRAHFSKQDCHRALSDISESIEELKHYKTYFFLS